MALSDEDYGILLNAVENDSHGTDTDFYGIILEWHYAEAQLPKESLSGMPWQQVKDYTSFIILSEGRELP